MIRSVIAIAFYLLISQCYLLGGINLETWDGPGTSNWTIEGYDGSPLYGTLSWVPSLGGQSGVLQNEGGGQTTEIREDIIYTTTGLAGGMDYSSGGLSVQFDFYADQLPQKLDIYILSGAGVDYEWFLNVTPTTTGWTSILMPLSFGQGWYTENGRTTASNFSADLAIVDRIGVRIWYANNDGGQIYGLDNFDVIPEPETWAFLGIAFLSVGYSFRERLDKAMAALMVRVRGC